MIDNCNIRLVRQWIDLPDRGVQISRILRNISRRIRLNNRMGTMPTRSLGMFTY